SVIVGSPGTNQTVIALLSDRWGSMQAALKVPVGSSGDESIKRERDALLDPAVRGKAPPMLLAGSLAGRPVVVTGFVHGIPGGPRMGIPRVAEATVVAPSPSSSRYAAIEHPWIVDVASRHEPDL